MVIEKSRINSVKKYFTNVEEDKEMYVCVPVNDRNISLLKMQDYSVGSCVVPEPIGSVTRFNLVGKDYVHKEMDKELRAIEKDYHIVDWHGTDHYGTCLQNRMCYPKEYLFPPLVRIILDNKILRSDILTKKQTDLLKHTINLFLEIFGYCEIVDKDEKPIINKTKLKEVSWKILPPGKCPWERVEKVLDYYFEKSLRKNKEVLRENHKVFFEPVPDFLAIGENSFNGYVVYGYVDRNLYIFESNQLGNATYVFKGEWEKASQLTKHDIIQGNLCYKRIVHSKNWKEEIIQLFNQ